tara:strand:- start:2135 stop:4075 length:1941 start_codon:yes stop_codon:yes gene_type:complete
MVSNKLVFTALLAIAATGQQMDYNTQLKNKPILSDAGASTFAIACARGSSGATVSITTAWLNVPTQSCSANLAFNGGSIQPASGAVVTLTGAITAAAVKIFDYAAGGTVSLSNAGLSLGVLPQWWGARPGLADSGPAFNAAWAAGRRMTIPEGTYTFATPIVWVGYQHEVYCASPISTMLSYTGGAVRAAVTIGDGGGLTNNVTIQNCGFLGNASVTEAAVFINRGDVVTLRNVFASNAPTGVRVSNSILFKADNLTVNGAGQPVVPTIGVLLSGEVGTTYGCNQALFINPQIQSLDFSSGRGLVITGPVGGETVGTHVIGGTIENMWLPIDIELRGGATDIDNVDLESTFSGILVRIASNATLHGKGSVYATGTIDILNTSVGVIIRDIGLSGYINIAAGATNILIDGLAASPNDVVPIASCTLSTASWGATGASGTNSYSCAAAHNLKTGDWVVVAGAAPLFYNSFAPVKITVTSATQFTWYPHSNPGAYVSGGTVSKVGGHGWLYDLSGDVNFSNVVVQPGTILQEWYVGNSYSPVNTFSNKFGPVKNLVTDDPNFGANNAIVGTFTFDGAVTPINLITGMPVTIFLAHTVDAAGVKTFNFNGTGAIPIRNRIGVSNTLTNTYTSGTYLPLQYSAGCGCWLEQ